MFENIGIVVKKNQEDGDVLFLDSLLPILSKYPDKIFIEDDAEVNNSLITKLKPDDFVTRIDLLIVFGGDGTLLGSSRKFLIRNTHTWHQSWCSWLLDRCKYR